MESLTDEQIQALVQGREYGMALTVRRDTPTPATSAPPDVVLLLQRNHDAYVRAGELPAGEPAFMVGPVWSAVDVGEDGELIPVAGKWDHAYAWYRLIPKGA